MGKDMYNCLRSKLVSLWHFTPIFVNLFVRWRHQLCASLQNWSCFDLWLSWPLTFRPLNGVTSHPCHGLLFLPIFSLLSTSIVDYMVRHWTDRRTLAPTMAINALFPTLGSGSIISVHKKRYAGMQLQKQCLNNRPECAVFLDSKIDYR